MEAAKEGQFLPFAFFEQQVSFSPNPSLGSLTAHLSLFAPNQPNHLAQAPNLFSSNQGPYFYCYCNHPPTSDAKRYPTRLPRPTWQTLGLSFQQLKETWLCCARALALSLALGSVLKRHFLPLLLSLVTSRQPKTRISLCDLGRSEARRN